MLDVAEIVYVLVAVTCLVCTLLLGRGYARSKQRLLLWSTLCFAGLFVNNVLTFVDLVIVPDVDLHPARSSLSFVSVAILAFGMIWESP